MGTAFGAGYACEDLIEYLQCFDGNYMTESQRCEYCPAGSYCNNNTQFSCPTETGNEYAKSDTGSSDITNCYITCESGDTNADKTIFWKGDINKFRCVCPVGYHIDDDGECESNIIDCTDGIEHAVTATKTWNGTAFGTCTITECESGYHVNTDDNGITSCISDIDTTSCTFDGRGVGEREWNHVTNEWGKCIATQCNPGYTNDPGMTNAIDPTQCGECSNTYGANGERVTSGHVKECEIATCMYQGEKYTLTNNECVLICVGSDETGYRTWNEAKGICEHTCYDGYETWSE